MDRGCCVLVGAEEARALLGDYPVLNKLGVIIKDKVDAQGPPSAQSAGNLGLEGVEG